METAFVISHNGEAHLCLSAFIRNLLRDGGHDEAWATRATEYLDDRIRDADVITLDNGDRLELKRTGD